MDNQPFVWLVKAESMTIKDQLDFSQHKPRHT